MSPSVITTGRDLHTYITRQRHPRQTSHQLQLAEALSAKHWAETFQQTAQMNKKLTNLTNSKRCSKIVFYMELVTLSMNFLRRN